MPAASGSARTRFTQFGLYSQRYSSFAGKEAAAAILGDEVTAADGYFARAVTGKESYFARAVTSEDAER